ncbi:MAG: hypothetical protein ACPG77_01925 [Nannocystaceae bacterium]
MSLALTIAPTSAHADEAQADQASETSPDAFAGSYRYVGGEAEKTRAHAAVEEIAAELNFMLRGIARKMLTKSATPKPTEVLEVHGKKVTLTLSKKAYNIEIDGPPVNFRGTDRKQYRMELRHRDNKLVLKITGHKSKTIKTYRLSEDGSRVKIKTKIMHPMMHKPLVYSFSYRR